MRYFFVSRPNLGFKSLSNGKFLANRADLQGTEFFSSISAKRKNSPLPALAAVSSIVD